jgi:hypothetical protein
LHSIRLLVKSIMKNQLNQDLLFKAGKQTLTKVKEEADNNLSSIHQSVEIITNKANNLFRLLFSVFILLFGFLVSRLTSEELDFLFYLSAVLETLLFVVLAMLYSIILPVKTALMGAEPKELIQSDVISGDDEKDEMSFLRISTFGLQNAIEHSTQSHGRRYKRFVLAHTVLIIGVGLIVLGTAAYFLIF